MMITAPASQDHWEDRPIRGRFAENTSASNRDEVGEQRASSGQLGPAWGDYRNPESTRQGRHKAGKGGGRRRTLYF